MARSQRYKTYESVANKERISLEQNYETKSGYEVVLLCDNAPGEFPFIGYYLKDGTACLDKWNGFGCHRTESSKGLVKAKKNHTLTRWVNVYRDDYDKMWTGRAYKTRAEADDTCATLNRIACKKITFNVEEGEGLDNGHV